MIVPRERLEALQSHLLLLFTGITRTSADVARTIVTNLNARAAEMHALQEMVDHAMEILLSPATDLMEFGRLIHETGSLPDTPGDDTIVRGFTLAQAALDAELAHAMGGRVDDDGEVALADSSGPVPYFNQAVLLRPLTSAQDPQLTRVESFFASSDGRPRTLLSMWPTPDLSTRGWTLMGHPAVREACVFGVPHPKWQERPMAAVVLKEGVAAEPDELREFLAKSFAKWQLPDAFVFLEAIPRTSVGKFKKIALREQFANWTWDQ